MKTRIINKPASEVNGSYFKDVWIFLLKNKTKKTDKEIDLCCVKPFK